jgi:hypothetical protein
VETADGLGAFFTATGSGAAALEEGASWNGSGVVVAMYDTDTTLPC